MPEFKTYTRPAEEEEGYAETSFNEQDYGDANTSADVEDEDEDDEDEDDEENLDDVNVDGMDDLPKFDGEKFEQDFFKKGGEEFKATMEKHRLEKLKAEKKYIRKQKRLLVNRVKKFYREFLNQEVAVGDGKGKGEASRELIEKTYIEYDEKTGKISKILFNGKTIFAKDGKGGFRLSEKAAKDKVAEFNKLRVEAALEHSKTANATIEEEIGTLPGRAKVDEIRKSIADEMQDDVIMLGDAIMARASELEGTNDTNLSNLSGVLNMKINPGDPQNVIDGKIGGVEANQNLYTDKVNAEKNLKVKTLFQIIVDVCKMKKAQLKMDANIAVEKEEEKEEVKEIVKNNILVKFEKFKEWVKENMGATAAITISVAGIITTVVLGVGKGVTTAAKATGALAKALAKMVKAVIPALVPLLNILVTALSWGAKGLAWLAKNLWVLAIGLSYIMYREYKEKYKSKQQ